MSRGAQELKKIIEEIFPNHKITEEYNVADRGSLFVDFLIKTLMIGFEYDGIQHYKYCEHFHGSRENFLKAKKRDLSKNDTCKEKGITLVRVAYNEDMTKELVLGKIEEALDGE